MKPTHLILTALLAVSTLVQAATVDRRLPAPLPEFKTPEQLAQWREEKAAQANSASQIPNSSLANDGTFFTGKPYLEEAGTYAFLFRSYDPELNRWTTSDPSGFPDGANNIAYMAVPTSEFDWQGLFSLSGGTPSPATFDSHDGNYALTVDKMVKTTAGSNELTLLQHYFPTYSFTLAANELPGSVSTNYYGGSGTTRSGQRAPTINLSFNYSGSAGGTLAWIQIATKTGIAGGNPFIDNGGMSYPFYPGAATTLTDKPTVGSWSKAPFFYASTFAVIRDGLNVAIYDGVHWGGKVSAVE